MLNWIMQLQLLLAALSAFFCRWRPSEYRERIAEVLDVAAKLSPPAGGGDQSRRPRR
ncbi:hypothetical protein [Vitreimonas flagellata]|uniref:hypothetical protein n=1 Tax=Vitreimonas flagellata TaxID=2560861 RepID=UPI00142F964B|nr:hypothetical protein [Vitreimonas flagellata]